jgi:hypothetical protein
MVENGSEGASDATRSGTEAEFGLQELAGTYGSREAEPAGAVIGCHDQLEVEEGTALPFEVDQGGEFGQKAVLEVESQAVAVGERLLLQAALAEKPHHLFPAFTALRGQ